MGSSWWWSLSNRVAAVTSVFHSSPLWGTASSVFHNAVLNDLGNGHCPCQAPAWSLELWEKNFCCAYIKKSKESHCSQTAKDEIIDLKDAAEWEMSTHVSVTPALSYPSDIPLLSQASLHPVISWTLINDFAYISWLHDWQLWTRQ